MILMKGLDRILEKPLEEQTGSTNQSKSLSIYGITSYAEIYNVPLEIRCSTGAASTININVNNLGVKPLKYKGLATLPENSILSGGTYRIMYNGTDFTLLNIAPYIDNNQLNTYISASVLSLTSSSTSSDITTAFGDSSKLGDFMEAIEESTPIFILESSNNSASLTTVIKTIMSIESTGGITTEIDTIQVIIPSTKILKTLSFVRAPGDSTYTSVTVTESNLAGFSVENSLTSDSTTNTPSIHAVNDALSTLDSRVTALENQT